MTYSVKVSTGTVTVRESNHIEVEQEVRLLRDGKEISKVVDKYVIAPEDDISGLKTRAAAFAKVARETPSDETIEPVDVSPVRVR